VRGLCVCRLPRFADPLPVGGASYTAEVAIDNFAEERRDAAYKPGSVPAIVRCNNMYLTEYRQRMNEALPGYRQQLLASGALAAKAAEPGDDYRNSGRPNQDLYYARSGFARGLMLHSFGHVRF
jgi:hypothetical protein